MSTVEQLRDEYQMNKQLLATPTSGPIWSPEDHGKLRSEQRTINQILTAYYLNEAREGRSFVSWK